MENPFNRKKYSHKARHGTEDLDADSMSMLRQPDHRSPVTGEEQTNPLATPLNHASIANTTHGGPQSPFYPPPNTFMPPEDSPLQSVLPSPAMPHQGLTMYPQVKVFGPVFSDGANGLLFQITYTSPNKPEGGPSAQRGHPSFRSLDPPQAHSSGLWSGSAQALNSFIPDPRQGYGAQILPRDQQGLLNQGGMLSTNTYPNQQRPSATDSLHSTGSQATSGDLDPSYRHAYPHEHHPYQQQRSNYQSMGTYGSQPSSPANNFRIHREHLNPQYTPVLDAAGGYYSGTPREASDYGNLQASQGPPQRYLDLQSAGNSGRQPPPTTRDSGIQPEFLTSEATSSMSRGGPDSILNPLGIVNAIQRAFPGFAQRSINQMVGSNNPWLVIPSSQNAEFKDNGSPTDTSVQSQQIDLRRSYLNTFDERWLRQTEDVWNLATRRTSRLTISPGEMTPEQQENTETFAEEARHGVAAPERRESRFKALHLFDSSSEDSRQHEEPVSDNGRQVETLDQHAMLSDRRHAIDISQAYSRLGIHDQIANDCMILISYLRSGFTSPSQTAELREALTIVAEARDSQYLKNFLSGGVYCIPEDNEERRTGLDKDAAVEDRWNMQAATTLSSSPDR